MDTDQKMKMILASASPRRKELLGWMKIPIIIIPSHVEEITSKTIPKDVVEDLAKLKGEDVFKNKCETIKNPFVVASDTIVVIEDRILGKPKDKDDARLMLSQLSGKEHEVYTAVYMAFSYKGKSYERIFSRSTHVTFKEISDDIMSLYLEGDEALDKAGSYGIQGQGLLFVDTVRGSYSNVVGFPLSDFIDEMKSFLVTVGILDWRKAFA